MKIRHILLKFVVWNMRWMTRYLGFLARPVVSWMADREVIACGFRDTDGGVRIIFSLARTETITGLYDRLSEDGKKFLPIR